MLRVTLITVVLTAGCRDLLELDRLRCGNGLHEASANEDCDGLPRDSAYACGAVGTAAACHYTCLDTPCPDGWRCGQDAVCRAPSASFEAPQVLSVEGTEIALGDLDGDALPDLVTLSPGQLAVAYGTQSGGFADVHRLSIPPAWQMQVGDLDGDGRADVALAADSIIVLRGTEQRVLAPVAASRPAEADPPRWAHRLRAVPSSAREEVLLAVGAREAPRFELAGRGLSPDVFAELAGLGSPASHTAVADLEGGETEDEIAVAFRGADWVPIVRVTCPEGDGRCASVVVTSLPLPAGYTVSANGTHFGDLDGDGRPDLWVAATGPEAPALLVSLQGPDGLGPLRHEPGLDAAAGCARCDRIAQVLQGPQALADLTGDARADVVTGLGVFRTAGDAGSPQAELVFAVERPLNGVGTADLNGDGFTDVFGESSGALFFALGGEHDTFELSASPVRVGPALVPGDFDGDGRMDLAAQSGRSLSVLFNGPTGLPAEAVLLAELDGPMPVTMVAARLPSPNGTTDRADDLLAFAGERERLFYGNTARLPLSPMATSARPRSLAIGRFLDENGSLAAGLEGADGRYVVTPGTTLGQASLDETPIEGCGGGASSRSLTANVPHDGRDVLLELDTEGPGGPGAARRLRTVDLRGRRCLWSAELRDALAPGDLLAGDLDGDGEADVAVSLTRFATLPAPGAPRSEEADGLALWRGPALAGPERLPLPEGVRSITRIDLGGGPELAVVAGTTAHRLRLGFGGIEQSPLLQVPAGVFAVRAADVDGDGLDDLVVKTTTSAFTYRQRACSAREAWEGTCTRSEP